MSEIAQVATIICTLLGKPPRCRTPAGPSRAVATLVVDAARRYKVDPLVLVSTVHHESSFRPDAVGEKGELGLCQLYRDTVATRGYDHLSDERLTRPRLNLRLGARRLAWSIRKCGTNDPLLYLSEYNGRYDGRECRASSYSIKVLGRLPTEIIQEVRRRAKLQNARAKREVGERKVQRRKGKL